MRLLLAAVLLASVGCQGTSKAAPAPNATAPVAEAALPAEGAERPKAVPAVPTENTMVGTWNVTLTADYSTCDDLAVGDVKQRQWLLGFENGLFTLKVLGTQVNEPTDYVGAVESAHIPPLIMFKAGAGAGIQLWLTGGADALEGRRVVASKQNDDECVKIFDLKARRAK